MLWQCFICGCVKIAQIDSHFELKHPEVVLSDQVCEPWDES